MNNSKITITFNIVIFDIDNCISNDRRRQPLLPIEGHGDADYEAYHADCAHDPVANGELVMRHRDGGDHLVFITARPRRYLAETTDWLMRNFGLLKNFTLLMREDGDTRPSAELKPMLFEDAMFEWDDVTIAYDDRQDVLAAYRAHGVKKTRQLSAPLLNASDVLQEMADTYRERNAVYGSNYKMVGPLMKILFPDGVPAELLHSDHFHLFELKLVKLSRFAISGLKHVDSIHDDAVYSAMIESILLEK